MSDISNSPRINRRTVLIGGAAVVAAAGMAGTFVLTRDRFVGAELSPPELLEAMRNDGLLLIDIRRPDEWERTGIAEGATPLDMRRDDFVTELQALVDGDVTRPVALICARGVRSDRLSARLTEAGFTQIIDVPEGMLGSSAGPGWIARDLPLVML